MVKRSYRRKCFQRCIRLRERERERETERDRERERTFRTSLGSVTEISLEEIMERISIMNMNMSERERERERDINLVRPS